MIKIFQQKLSEWRQKAWNECNGTCNKPMTSKLSMTAYSTTLSGQKPVSCITISACQGTISCAQSRQMTKHQ